MASGPINCSEEWRWQSNIGFSIFIGHAKFNFGNILIDNVCHGVTLIYRCVAKRTALCCIQKTVPFGGGNVLIWQGICCWKRTEMVINGNVNAKCYSDLTSRRVTVSQYNPMTLFIQDSVRPHTARVVQQFLSMKKFVLCHGQPLTRTPDDVPILQWTEIRWYRHWARNRGRLLITS